MQINKRYINFLKSLKDSNPSLIETIEKGFNIIFESTEEVVERAKEALKKTEPVPEKETRSKLDLSEEVPSELLEEDII
jgi:hypothetical protein